MHSAQSSRRATMDPDYDSTTITTNEQGNHDYYSAYSAYNSNPYEESVSEPVQQPQPQPQPQVQPQPQRQSQARLSRSSVQGPGSPKRRSVFSARSRNTSTSSHRTPSTSVDHAAACQDAVAATAAVAAAATTTTSTTTGYPPLRTERQDSLTKSLFNRGSRILRRQGSKFSISATLDEVDEEREKPRFDVTDLFGRRSRQSSTNDNLKRLISDPYDFHHLTHTSPSHVQSLQRARENDLVTEFSAIRASQKPDTSLKGIRAEDLHFPDVPRCTTPGVATAGDDEHAYAIPAATATSPPASPGALSSISPKQMPRRESRVCENFSRPVSRYPRNGSESSIGSVPPFSLQQQQQQQQKPVLAASPVLESESEPEPMVDHSRKVSLSQMNLTALFESTESLSLEDVPEEPTGTNWHDSPVEETHEPLPVSVPESSSTLAPPPAPVFVTGRKFSEALASPTIPQYFQTTESEMPNQHHQHQHQHLPEEVSHADVLDAIYDSWDADIDYCYEHAAESTSNFDWSRRSFEDQQHPTILEEEPEPQPSIHLSTSSLFCPSLDPSPSSRSVPSTQMLATPSTAYSEYFQGPMLPLAADGNGKPMPIQEPLYSDDYSDQDRHLSFCSQGGVNVIPAPMDQVSPRSSFSPISNYNSQESLVLSRAASLARKHRSSISATSSIPELVNSLSSHETMPTDSSSSFSSSLHHRPSKSLETSQIFGAAGSTGGHGLGLAQGQVSSHPEESSHDRTKSTSDIIYKDLPPLPAVKGHKRAAYSLFPGQ